MGPLQRNSLRLAIRRLAFGRPIVVVSGLPRSGTSMIMRMLEAGGLPLLVDDVRKPDEANPHGYFEYERVRTLDVDRNKAWLRAARGKALKVVSPLLRFLPSNHNYRVIVMHRDVREILASQNRMLERAGLPTNVIGEERMRDILEGDLRKAQALLDRRSCFESIHVRYTDVLHHPAEQSERIAAFLRCDLELEKMARAVDVRLYRTQVSPSDRV